MPIPLQSTLMISLKYGADLLAGVCSDDALKQLLAEFKSRGDSRSKCFDQNNYSRWQAICDFVEYIAPYFSSQKLHGLVNQLVKIEGDLFAKKETLLYAFLVHETTLWMDERNIDIFNKLREIAFPIEGNSSLPIVSRDFDFKSDRLINLLVVPPNIAKLAGSHSFISENINLAEQVFFPAVVFALPKVDRKFVAHLCAYMCKFAKCINENFAESINDCSISGSDDVHGFSDKDFRYDLRIKTNEFLRQSESDMKKFYPGAVVSSFAFYQPPANSVLSQSSVLFVGHDWTDLGNAGDSAKLGSEKNPLRL